MLFETGTVKWGDVYQEGVKKGANRMISTKALVSLCFVFLVAVPIAGAALEVGFQLNQTIFGGADYLEMDVQLVNTGANAVFDLYVCLEIYGEYYFYPSFSKTELDHRVITVEEGQAFTDSVIPRVILPEDLPDFDSTVYGICFEPGTWNIVSNLATIVIKLRSDIPVLPKPDYDNSFFLMPGVEGLDYNDPQSAFDQVALDLLSHFQDPGLYVRRGVTLLDPVVDSENRSKAMETADKIASTGMALGFHVGVTCHHSYGEMVTVRQADRRNNQWDSTGAIFDTGHDDLSTVTLSRYASDVVAIRRHRAEATGTSFHEAYLRYPETVVFVNGPIEVELRKADDGQHHYADYSPFAVKEFRDWLCHTGIYHDRTGRYAGQGIPLELINDIEFAADESPDETNNERSFNQVFGTSFTTWSLRYWDPEFYPESLDLEAVAKPVPGETGHIDGGFDPPRDVNGQLTGGNELFQTLWDGWRTNSTNGNQTGFGFRQSMVHRYVEDNSKWLLNSGVPIERNFTHQIPVDFIGNWIRERSSASPHWTAFNPYSNPGFTAYFDTTLQEDLFEVASSLSEFWGMFEFHPDPFLEQPVSYYLQALEALYKQRCKILVPIDLYETSSGNYRLIGSQFETAVNLFLQSRWGDSSSKRFDQPYHNTTWIDYRPPEVTGLTLSQNKIVWNASIWKERTDIEWTNWNDFRHFEIHVGDHVDFTPGVQSLLGTTRNNWFDVPSTTIGTGFFKVLAVSQTGLKSR